MYHPLPKIVLPAAAGGFAVLYALSPAPTCAFVAGNIALALFVFNVWSAEAAPAAAENGPDAAPSSPLKLWSQGFG